MKYYLLGDFVMRRMLLLLLIIGALTGCAGTATTENLNLPGNATTGNPANPASRAVVYIYGHEVHSQGTYPWHSGMTVKDLIKAAEGLSEFAGHSRIHITHADGTRDTFKYASILSGETKDPTLRPEDAIHVSTPYF